MRVAKHDVQGLQEGGEAGGGGHLKPARPELVVGYTFHRLLVAQFGTMVTPNPSPIATQRMNRLRLVKGSIEMTCAMHNNNNVQVSSRC